MAALDTDLKIRLDDKYLFGNDAGEDEDESVLMSYFVDRGEFAKFLDPTERLQVAKGRKGTGKSALLVRFAHDRRVTSEPLAPVVLHLVPSNLVALKEPPNTEDATIIENYWKQVICAAINMELARDIGFAWNDDKITLVENAELAGFQGRNLISALMSRLVSKINAGAVEIAPTPLAAKNDEQLLTRIRKAADVQRPVWFLLDDIDKRYQNTPREQAFIASFFSASRDLVRELKGVGIRATVRTDVWASLVGGTEDLDKFEQYMTDITWSGSQQQNILTQRILAYMKRSCPGSDAAQSWSVQQDADRLLALVFTERMKWGNAAVPAAHVLRILAGGRPRWIAQLCGLAGTKAAHERSDRIAFHHVRQVMRQFGQRRLSDLYKEHQYQFGDLKALVESFRAGPRDFTTENLLKYLQAGYIAMTGTARIPLIDGVPYASDRQLARFLFKIGFVNGHNADYRTRHVPEFVAFEERPDLLDVETNLDDGMTWEVLPAYRNVLHI